MVRAEEGVLRKLLEGERQYRIPLYQRPYQWGKQQWQTLWNDIVDHLDPGDSTDAASSHFIGSMVLVPMPDSYSAMGVSQLLVVDGQQRLTTLTLLLAALRDYHREHGNQAGAQKVHNQFLVNQYQEGDQRIKLVPTQQNRGEYSAVINQLPTKGAGGRVGEAYLFFRSKLENLAREEVTELERFVLNGLSVVSITTHKEDNVHRIFQSLNNTGLQLTQGDLIRNLIFMRLGDDGDWVYQKIWYPMEQTLPTNNDLETLFWLDLLRKNPKLKQDATFAAYQKHLDTVQSRDEIVEEVRRIAGLAEVYALILVPDREQNPDVRDRLARLKEWKTTTPHSLMLEILRRRSAGQATDAETARTLELIESYLVRRLVTGISTNGLNRVFPQVLGLLRDDAPVDTQVHEILSTGRRHFATDAEIRRATLESPFFEKGRREHKRVFMQWLEQSFKSKEPVDTAGTTIEHVMPQTLDATWTADLVNAYGTDAYLEEYNATVHTLGNLTLSGYNSELGNKAFNDKKQEYARTGIRLSADLLNYEEWGPQQIRERSAALAERIIQTWPGPVEAVSDRGDQLPLWNRVAATVAAIPPGRWATYGDVAAAAGTAAQPVGNYLASQPVLNAHRVMKSDGSIAKNFRWLDPQEQRSAREVLEEEGLTFTTTGKADPARRLSLEELLDLADDFE